MDKEKNKYKHKLKLLEQIWMKSVFVYRPPFIFKGGLYYSTPKNKNIRKIVGKGLGGWDDGDA